MLRSEPKEEEMPLEREDLAIETQEVFDLYDKLPAKWDTMSGHYMGKDLVLLPILCDEFEISSCIRKYAWTIIPFIDNIVAEDVARKIKEKTRSAKSGGNSL